MAIIYFPANNIPEGIYTKLSFNSNGEIIAASQPTKLTELGITDGLSNATTSTQQAYFGKINLKSLNSSYLTIANIQNLTANRNLNISINDIDTTIFIKGFTEISGVNTGDQLIGLYGDIIGEGIGPIKTELSTTGVIAGIYGKNNFVPKIEVDLKGRLIDVQEIKINITPNEITGVLNIEKGGTGRETIGTNGQVLVSENNGFEFKTLEAGENIGIEHNGNNIKFNVILNDVLTQIYEDSMFYSFFISGGIS